MAHLTKRKSLASTLSLFILSAGLLGCGGGSEGQNQNGLSGTVRVDGSSTVFPITEAVAEEFNREQPSVRVSVGVSGTGGGFAKFLRQETDINNASRPIKETELTQAQQNNLEFIELPVAYDGIAVVAHPENSWLECLTVDELRKIWEPNSSISNWNQIRPSFPNQELHLYGPGTDSGTYDYFTEAVMGESGASRTDFTASEDDNVLVQGVAGDPNALGFFGLAYFEENQGQLKPIGIDDGDPSNGTGCVLPSTETVADGSYQPLARPIFVYVNRQSADSPPVQTFVEFYLENAGVLAEEVGYVPLSDNAYNLALERFRNRTSGTLFKEAEAGVNVEAQLRQGSGAAGGTTAPADSGAASDTTARP